MTLLPSMIQYPQGFTDILFVNEKPDEPHFFLAESYEKARNTANRMYPTYPVPPGDLTRMMRKTEMRSFLLSFGTEWCTKQGMIFFKRSNNGPPQSASQPATASVY